MFFNVFHVSISFVLTFFNLVNAIYSFDVKKIKKYNLEKLFLSSLSSLFWILFGFLKGLDDKLLTLEIFIFSITISGIIIKLNLAKTDKIFGKLIPGYGVPESGLIKKIKFLFCF